MVGDVLYGRKFSCRVGPLRPVIGLGDVFLNVSKSGGIESIDGGNAGKLGSLERRD